jgi:hypothetical protein
MASDSHYWMNKANLSLGKKMLSLLPRSLKINVFLAKFEISNPANEQIKIKQCF